MSVQNEIILTESRTLRDDYVFKDSVLERVKAVPVLSGTLEVTVEMAANFYEVPIETVRTVLKRNRAEFNDYGEVRLLKGKVLESFKTQVQGEPSFKGLNSLSLVTRRGLLRIGMLLTESEVARSVRNYLLNVEGIASKEQRMWSMQREVSKRERRRLTDAVQTFGDGSTFAYANYTNLVYRVLFDTDAPGLRKLYGLEPDDNIRDALSTDDLRSVVDVETAISSLLRLGYGYREIRDELLSRKANFRREAA
ncbi:hypothetical protein [Paenibacillus vini]|uniref:KilA-N DNA-binding domain-containing protein n=1 Tax=Paenibacillus vini TaxID=1476024 RepID=A0ABQ4MH17_9BACL|nr:hypothetical protein [Paenibacillus vini]GIP55275.1 hypothetical protein J42TS3_43100 [Paenibacillus vini]